MPTDPKPLEMARRFAVEVADAVLKLEHVSTEEGGCPHFDDGDSRSCNDCQALRVRSVLESRLPALLDEVRDENGYAQGVRDQREFQVALIEEDRVLTRERRDSEWSATLFPHNEDTDLGRECRDPEMAYRVLEESAKLALSERDSEWVKAVKKARGKWLGNAVAACDEILREMKVTPEQIQREREEVERKIREGIL